MVNKKILFLSDLNYQAKARSLYAAEDIYLTGILRKYFDLAICNVASARSFEDNADLIVIRNIGATTEYKDDYVDFRNRVHRKNLKTFNELNGIGDQVGKQYLIDLCNKNFPVMPSVDSVNDIDKLKVEDKFCIKPKGGADSIGLEFINLDDLLAKNLTDGEYIIQPAIDFEYELSFYFINNDFKYALYAPDKQKR